MIKRIFFSLIIGFQLTSVSAQTSLGVYRQMADAFYSSNNYTSAIEVYERLLFFGNDSFNKEIYLPLARAYSKIGEYEKASIHFNSAYNNESIDTLKYEIIFENAINYILANDTNLAYSELLNIPEINISNRIKNKLNLITATLEYKSGRYTDSKRHFLAITELDSEDKLAIEQFFKNTTKINRKYNPVMVEWMSVVPGLGQAWCGYYKESANALLLTGALTLLYLDISIKYRVLDGLLSVYPWANRYYKGGILNAKKIAIKKREAERNKLYNRLLKTLPPIT